MFEKFIRDCLNSTKFRTWFVRSEKLNRPVVKETKNPSINLYLEEHKVTLDLP